MKKGLLVRFKKLWIGLAIGGLAIGICFTVSAATGADFSPRAAGEALGIVSEPTAEAGEFELLELEEETPVIEEEVTAPEEGVWQGEYNVVIQTPLQHFTYTMPENKELIEQRGKAWSEYYEFVNAGTYANLGEDPPPGKCPGWNYFVIAASGNELYGYDPNPDFNKVKETMLQAYPDATFIELEDTRCGKCTIIKCTEPVPRPKPEPEEPEEEEPVKEEEQ